MSGINFSEQHTEPTCESTRNIPKRLALESPQRPDGSAPNQKLMWKQSSPEVLKVQEKNWYDSQPEPTHPSMLAWTSSQVIASCYY